MLLVSKYNDLITYVLSIAIQSGLFLNNLERSDDTVGQEINRQTEVHLLWLVTRLSIICKGFSAIKLASAPKMVITVS